MAKKEAITNIAHTLKCVAKLKAGKACTMSELKSSLLILDTAYKTAKSTIRETKDRLRFMERFMAQFRN